MNYKGKNPAQIKAELEKYSGSDKIFKLQNANILYTEGVQYLAESCSAYWLLQKVGAKAKELIPKSDFIAVKFEKLNSGGVLNYSDGNGNILHYEQIVFTYFPLEKIDLFFRNDTLLLPNEY